MALEPNYINWLRTSIPRNKTLAAMDRLFEPYGLHIRKLNDKRSMPPVDVSRR